MRSGRDIFWYMSVVLPLAMMACCFLPWVHYNGPNLTFNGFNVVKFSSGVYYGKAGIPITILAGITFILSLLRARAAGHIALSVSAFLFAYCVRTYILFTGSLFAGEVEKYAGIYLIAALPLGMVVGLLFRRTHKVN